LAAANTTPAVVDVLLMMWLPEISMNDRDELIREIQLSLSGTDRTARPETKAAQLDFIRRRNVTPNLRRRVRAAFLRAHKTSRSVPQSTGKLRAQHEFPRELVGLGSTPTVEPYPHQVQAWEKLDALAASRGDRRAGQLVLPTGSGKTFTSVRWLLLQLSKGPALRVLWIADQQELLDQAARQFEADAETMPEGFVTRRLRVLHSAAVPITALADDELDVAAAERVMRTWRGTQGRRGRGGELGTHPSIPAVRAVRRVDATRRSALCTRIPAISEAGGRLPGQGRRGGGGIGGEGAGPSRRLARGAGRR